MTADMFVAGFYVVAAGFAVLVICAVYLACRWHMPLLGSGCKSEQEKAIERNMKMAESHLRSRQEEH